MSATKPPLTVTNEIFLSTSPAPVAFELLHIFPIEASHDAGNGPTIQCPNPLAVEIKGKFSIWPV